FVAAILLAACGGGGSDGGSGGTFVTVNSASVEQNNQNISSLELSSGGSPIQLKWNVSFSNPTSLYSMTVSAESSSGASKKLLYQNCGAEAGVLYNCGKSGNFQCQVNDNQLDCKINRVGEAPYFNEAYQQITFEACVYGS